MADPRSDRDQILDALQQLDYPDVIDDMIKYMQSKYPNDRRLMAMIDENLTWLLNAAVSNDNVLDLMHEKVVYADECMALIARLFSPKTTGTTANPGISTLEDHRVYSAQARKTARALLTAHRDAIRRQCNVTQDEAFEDMMDDAVKVLYLRLAEGEEPTNVFDTTQDIGGLAPTWWYAIGMTQGQWANEYRYAKARMEVLGTKNPKATYHNVYMLYEARTKLTKDDGTRGGYTERLDDPISLD
ncbi:hypothetical protein ACET3X_008503 [Alternaria dauci]|uniref:Uncharacterized protein n=1 Tax=Alternaria dauci TaxID=48095 RepID=A0ABR3UD36_9PLEO